MANKTSNRVGKKKKGPPKADPEYVSRQFRIANGSYPGHVEANMNRQGYHHYQRGNRPKPEQPEPVEAPWLAKLQPIVKDVYSYFCDTKQNLWIYQPDGAYFIVSLDAKQCFCRDTKPTTLQGLNAILEWLTEGGVTHVW